MIERSGFYRQALAIFVGIFLFVLVGLTIEKTGLSRFYTVILTACALLAVWTAASFSGATTTASKFFLANRNVRTTVNALAITSALSLPIMLGDAGGIMIANPSLLIVIMAAILVGIAMSALLAAGKFQKSGVKDIAQYLTWKNQNPLAARCVTVATTLAGMALTVCGLDISSMLTSWFFGVSRPIALVIISLAVILTATLGGKNSNTRLAAVSAALLLIAINLPLVLNSIALSGFPLGHFTFGSDALVDSWDLEDQLASLQIPRLAEIISPLSPIAYWSGGLQVVAGVVIASAVAFYPALFQQYSVCSNTENTAASVNKSILFVGFLSISIFAHLAFTQFGLYQTVLGLSAIDARVEAPFLFSWGDRNLDLVTVCNSVMSQPNELLSTCPDGGDHVLSIQDIGLNSHLIFAASPDLTGLPFVYSAFLAGSLVLAGTAFTAMIVLSSSANLVSAFYSSASGSVLSARIFQNRIAIVLLVCLSAAYTHYYDFDTLALFVFSMNVLASALVPALTGSLFLQKKGSGLLATSVAMSFVAAILYFALSKFGFDFIPNSGDEFMITLPGMNQAIPPELSAIFAVPIGLVVLLAGLMIQDEKKPGHNSLDPDQQ